MSEKRVCHNDTFLFLFTFQLTDIPFGIDSSTATRTCSGNPLTINRIHDISGSEHTRHIGTGRSPFGNNITLFVYLYILTEYFGIRMMTDSQEESVDADVKLLFVGFALWRTR